MISLTRGECRFLAFAAPEILAKLRQTGLDSPAIRKLLADLHDAATDNCGSVADPLPKRHDANELAETDNDDLISTAVAAARLETSPRGLLTVCRPRLWTRFARSTRGRAPSARHTSPT